MHGSGVAKASKVVLDPPQATTRVNTDLIVDRHCNASGKLKDKNQIKEGFPMSSRRLSKSFAIWDQHTANSSGNRGHANSRDDTSKSCCAVNTPPIHNHRMKINP